MSDKPLKAFERWCAQFIGGQRYTANQGDRVDVESDGALFQCNEVKTLSLDTLTCLAEEMSGLANHKNKVGGVLVKVRRGGGQKSAPLVVLTADIFDQYFNLRKDGY